MCLFATLVALFGCQWVNQEWNIKVDRYFYWSFLLSCLNNDKVIISFLQQNWLLTLGSLQSAVTLYFLKTRWGHYWWKLELLCCLYYWWMSCCAAWSLMTSQLKWWLLLGVGICFQIGYVLCSNFPLPCIQLSRNLISPRNIQRIYWKNLIFPQHTFQACLFKQLMNIGLKWINFEKQIKHKILKSCKLHQQKSFIECNSGDFNPFS